MAGRSKRCIHSSQNSALITMLQQQQHRGKQPAAKQCPQICGTVRRRASDAACRRAHIELQLKSRLAAGRSLPQPYTVAKCQMQHQQQQHSAPCLCSSCMHFILSMEHSAAAPVIHAANQRGMYATLGHRCSRCVCIVFAATNETLTIREMCELYELKIQLYIYKFLQFIFIRLHISKHIKEITASYQEFKSMHMFISISRYIQI